MKQLNMKKIQAQAQRNLEKNPEYKHSEAKKKDFLKSCAEELNEWEAEKRKKRNQRAGTPRGDYLNEMEDIADHYKKTKMDGLAVNGRYGGK